jgi:hypothetical protein
MTGRGGRSDGGVVAQRRRRLLLTALGGVTVVLLAVAAAFVVLSNSPTVRPAARVAPRPRRSVPVVTSAATFPSAEGLRSAAVIAENRKTGENTWMIAGAPSHGMIEGFADRNYVRDGDSFNLYVSTTARSFHVVAYRMGYYQGAGARQVWSSEELAGKQQPPCPVTASTNMVSCDNWSKSLTVSVTGAWPAGDYLLKLVGAGREQAYVLLTVWDPTSHAAYLIVNRSLTEQGWYTFGGYDYYQGQGPCILDDNSYPPCNRARVVSFDRPYAQADGSSDFLGNEYPLIRWMEQQGLDLTYATDITLTQHPAVALQHRAWLSLDHDETWTYGELQAARSAVRHGVNLAFFSGAAIVRHSRLQPSPLGADRQEVDYRNSEEDPAHLHGDPTQVTGNTWDLADSALTGEEYSGYLLPGAAPAPMVVADAQSWLFEHTGLHNGSQIPAAIGSDIDHIDPGSGLMPTDLQVLAHSPIPLTKAYTNEGDWAGDTYSDFTYYTSPTSRAGVLDTGDTTFITDLTPCATPAATCPQPTLTRIVGNILRLFGQGPAGDHQPSVANWSSISPSGS